MTALSTLRSVFLALALFAVIGIMWASIRFDLHDFVATVWVAVILARGLREGRMLGLEREKHPMLYWVAIAFCALLVVVTLYLIFERLAGPLA